MKIKRNTAFFLIYGIILTIFITVTANLDSIWHEPLPFLIFIVVLFTPTFIVLILNKILNVQKKEQAKKIIKIMITVADILLTIFLTCIMLVWIVALSVG